MAGGMQKIASAATDHSILQQQFQGDFQARSLCRKTKVNDDVKTRVQVQIECES
jgi:hypothetical protein